MKRIMFTSVLVIFLLCFLPLSVYGKEAGEHNDVYDQLRVSIQNEWDRGFEQLEENEEIEVKGPLSERIVRGIANAFYKNLTAIKAGSLIIGIISLVLGAFIAIAAKLNKKVRKFAIGGLMITIPIFLFIFVFGVTKLVSIFI